MCYARFERDISDKYQITLEGWPFPVLRNLADEHVSNAELVRLHKSIVEGECHFRPHTAEEITERSARQGTTNGSTSKPRAQRSDKGLKRGPQQATLARGRIASQPVLPSSASVSIPLQQRHVT